MENSLLLCSLGILKTRAFSRNYWDGNGRWRVGETNSRMVSVGISSLFSAAPLVCVATLSLDSPRGQACLPAGTITCSSLSCGLSSRSRGVADHPGDRGRIIGVPEGNAVVVRRESVEWKARLGQLVASNRKQSDRWVGESRNTLRLSCSGTKCTYATQSTLVEAPVTYRRLGNSPPPSR